VSTRQLDLDGSVLVAVAIFHVARLTACVVALTVMSAVLGGSSHTEETVSGPGVCERAAQ
jgi:hypothetical protein